jgi:hypothetical protein
MLERRAGPAMRRRASGDGDRPFAVKTAIKLIEKDD